MTDDGPPSLADVFDPGGAGRSVLVVGAVPEQHHATLCRRVMTAEGTTRRLLVLCGQDTGTVDDHLGRSPPRDRQHLRVIDHGRSGDSTTSDGEDSEDGPLDEVRERTAGDDLGALGATISGAVDDLETVAGGFDPGELRTCYDSLTPLVAEHGETDVFGFLHILVERLYRASAVSTFHFPTRRDDPAVTMLEPLFDDVLVLGTDGDEPRFRRADDERWRPLDDDPDP